MTQHLVTTFAGVNFGPGNPYSPQRAKSALELAMTEIRQSDALRDIGVDRALAGRDRVKEEREGVWDFVRLVGSNGDRAFNELPHFTLAIRPEEILAVLILPNKWLATPAARHALEDLGFDGFHTAIANATTELTAVAGSCEYARPWILLQQRRATKGQQLNVRDARIEFDPQTAVGLQGETTDQNHIKPQPQWLQAVYSALVDKEANLEMCIGAQFLYGDPVVRTPELISKIIGAWGACRPVLDAILHS